MPTETHDWVYWGLLVTAAVCTVGAAVTAAPSGWSWPAFFTAAATALGGLAKVWGPTPSK